MATLEKTFKNAYGTFIVDAETNAKTAALFEKYGHSAEEELRQIRPYISPTSIIADIGAHIGTITIPLARIAQKVHAFEPFVDNLGYLERNIKANSLSNVKVHRIALGNKDGKVGLVQRNSENTGAGTIEGIGDIPLAKLDDIVGRVDFIKIDVEGYEPEVLEGAKATLHIYKPTVFFEVNLPELRRHGKSSLRRIERALKGYTYHINGQYFPSLWLACLWLEPKYFLLNRGSGIVFNVLASK